MNRKHGIVLLALGTMLFAASFSVVTRLIQLGEGHLVDDRNPISFCNVLFAGNLVAGLVFALLFFRDCTPRCLNNIPAKGWVTLILVALLEGGLAPTFIFTALEEISVASVVLVQSIQIPLALLAAWAMHGERVHRAVMLGAIIAVGGVAIMVGLKTATSPSGDETIALQLGLSEIKVALASILFVVATQLRRRLAWQVPVGLYSVVRTIAGSIFFAIVVLVYFGPTHFMDVTNAYLWKWMLFYGIAIVVIGQLAWHFALRVATAAEISVAEAATPVIGIACAFLLLGQMPSNPEMIGGFVVLTGIALTVRGALAHRPTDPGATNDPLFQKSPGPFTGI